MGSRFASPAPDAARERVELLVVLSGSATAEARAVHRITSPMVQVGVPAVVPTGAVDLGPVSGRSRLTLEIALKLRDPRALDRSRGGRS